tara:strand:- start:93 stop:449 length:357 start_codon:yes stop_codon:yes gene_type:complete
MFNFKALILITIALILTGCSDPRAADKEELANVLHTYMPFNYTSDEREKSVKCVIDVLDKELSDDAWTLFMFWARDDRDGADAWAEKNNVNRKAINGEIDLAMRKTFESCDAADLTIN